MSEQPTTVQQPPEAPYGSIPPPPPAPPKRLTRSRDDKMVAGVCGGLAEYFNIDPTLVRIGAVVALCLGFPAVLLGYVVAWAIVPQTR